MSGGRLKSSTYIRLYAFFEPKVRSLLKSLVLQNRWAQNWAEPRLDLNQPQFLFTKIYTYTSVWHIPTLFMEEAGKTFWKMILKHCSHISMNSYFLKYKEKSWFVVGIFSVVEPIQKMCNILHQYFSTGYVPTRTVPTR